jgi:hypothetical protein
MSPTHQLPPRPKAATLFMATPIVFLSLLGLSFAVLFGVTRFGDASADGRQAAIEFRGSCIEEASPLLAKRAEQIGMPVAFDGATLNTTLPDMPEAETLIPAVLVTPGDFSLVSADGTVRFENRHIGEVAIDLDNSGMPVTLLKMDAGTRQELKPLDDDLEFTPTVDGTAFQSVKASELKDEAVVTLHSGEGITSARMKRAADLAIVLEHGPLPCALRIHGVSTAESHGDTND